jgi:hypothetical protein
MTEAHPHKYLRSTKYKSTIFKKNCDDDIITLCKEYIITYKLCAGCRFFVENEFFKPSVQLQERFSFV